MRMMYCAEQMREWLLASSSTATMKATTLRPFFPAAFVLLFALQLIGCIAGVPAALEGRTDFRSFYMAGYAVRTGHGAELYDYEFQKRLQNELTSQSDVALMFYHPACEALLFVPLSFFSFRTAYFVYGALNALLLALTIRMVRGRLSHLSELWRPLPIAIFLCFFPIGIALKLGQDSILLLFLYSASFIALSQGKDFRAGVFLGLALVKFQIAIPVAFLFLLWRRWRFVAGFAAAGTILLAVSVGVVGLAGVSAYLRPLLAVGGGLGTAAERLTYGVYPRLMPNLRGLVDGLTDNILGVRAAHLVTAVISLLVIVWAAMRRRSFPLALTAALVVSYHLNPHDLSLLALPIALVLDGAFAQKASLTRRDLTAVSLAALFLFTPVYVWLWPPELVYLLAVPLAALLFVSPGVLPEDMPSLPAESSGGYRSADH